MAILHFLNAIPDSPAFKDCLRLLSDSDAVLLTGDAVYAAIATSPGYLQLINSEARLYALEDVTRASGVIGQIGDQITLQDYDDFVALTEEFERLLSWY